MPETSNYTIIGPDPANAGTHIIIEVGGRQFSCFIGTEARTANEVLGILEPEVLPPQEDDQP